MRFLSNIIPAFEFSDINLQEAAQLASLSADRLDYAPVKAADTRRKVLHVHLMIRASQNSLCARMVEILDEVVEASTET